MPIHADRGDWDCVGDPVEVVAGEVTALWPSRLVPVVRDKPALRPRTGDTSPQRLDCGRQGHAPAKIQVRNPSRALHEVCVSVDESRYDNLPAELDDLRRPPRPFLRLRVRPHSEDPPAAERDPFRKRVFRIHRVDLGVHEDEVRVPHFAGASLCSRSTASFKVSSRFENMNRTKRSPSSGSE